MKQTIQKYIGCLLVSALLLTLFITGVLGRFEHMAQDRLYRDFGVVHPDIFIIGIDEKTLIEFGPLQYWPRQRMAEAIEILNSEPGWEPAVIAVDMIYSGERLWLMCLSGLKATMSLLTERVILIKSRENSFRLRFVF